MQITKNSQKITQNLIWHQSVKISQFDQQQQKTWSRYLLWSNHPKLPFICKRHRMVQATGAFQKRFLINWTWSRPLQYCFPFKNPIQILPWVLSTKIYINIQAKHKIKYKLVTTIEFTYKIIKLIELTLSRKKKYYW